MCVVLTSELCVLSKIKLSFYSWTTRTPADLAAAQMNTSAMPATTLTARLLFATVWETTMGSRNVLRIPVPTIEKMSTLTTTAGRALTTLRQTHSESFLLSNDWKL